VLRLTVWREQARRGYSVSDQAQIFAMTSFYPLPPAKKYWSLTLSPIELARTSALEGIKHTNRLNQVLAAQHLRNFDECLMGTENFLYCGHKSNLFFRMNGCWYTPINREYGVEGVMQSHILHLFAEHNINIERKPLALDKLKDLEAVFMSNALVGAVPVSQLNELHLSVDAVADLFIDQLQSPHLLAGNWV
jgi:4-amino-4-deoxychorismate lyase